VHLVVAKKVRVHLVAAKKVQVHLVAAKKVRVQLVVAKKVRRWFGRYFLLYRPFLAHYLLNSYSCGSVDHLSRDCTRGEKCFNCSRYVSHFYPLSNCCSFDSRATQAETAPCVESGEFVTVVVQKTIFLAIAYQ
jgi:hypothetical protein